MQISTCLETTDLQFWPTDLLSILITMHFVKNPYPLLFDTHFITKKVCKTAKFLAKILFLEN